MSETNDVKSSADSIQKVTRKRTRRSFELAEEELGSSGPPCGACKFLRKRCVNGCIFAPHFSPDQGAALFAAVHKVFGASNVSKLLMHLPVSHRRHAVETISYEAQARLSDPVYGCVSTVIALQQQVAALQLELAIVQNQLLNNRLTVANTLQGSLQLQEPLHLQPVYSNGSNNNKINMNTFDPSLHNIASDNYREVHSESKIDPFQLSPLFHEDWELSEDPLAFADQILQYL
ncbi:LOB domain-containing protein 19-like [Rutidosis leptorrhynchoides]|uniref:LOB domain-containing protein 19-like n=1 Tax=Rutidosis leptorrhynchoides TaxID=125765 RepID=UPI003A992223